LEGDIHSGFIVSWTNKVREYESFITDPLDHFSNAQKLYMLQNTVADTPELRQVHMNTELEVAKGGARLTYEQYTMLLLSAASAFDQSISATKFKPRNQHVFLSETDGGFTLGNDDNDEVSQEDNKDIYDVNTYPTNITARKPPIQAQKQLIP
jgi:hypothetical protein